jgi:hypothetical protein
MIKMAVLKIITICKDPAILREILLITMKIDMKTGI